MNKDAFAHVKKQMLYCGAIYLEKNACKFEVTGIETIPTKFGYYTGMPYFVFPDYSSEYIEDRWLDTPTAISGNLTLFYSRSEDACREWLEKELKERTAKVRDEFEKLKSASVERTGTDFLPKDLDERVLSMLKEENDEEEEKER